MSGKGYEIPITTPGSEQVLSAFDKIAEKMRDVARVSQQSIHRVRSTAQQNGRGLDDPWRRLEQLNSLNAPPSDYNAQRALDLARERAWRRANRANQELMQGPPLPKGGARALEANKPDPIHTMFMRTRLKIGPWQPLVGDLVKNGLLDATKVDSMLAKISGSAIAKRAAASLAGAALPILLGGAAVAGAGALAIKWGVNGLENQFGAARGYYAGGGGKGYGATSSILGPLGMDPRQSADFAVQFGERLRQGGYGASVLRSKGVIDLGRYTINKFENLEKAIDALRKMDERKAMMVARDVGLSDALWVRDLSQGSYEALKNSGNWQNDPGARLGSAEWQSIKQRTGNSWDQFQNSLTLPFSDMAIMTRLREQGRYGDMAKLAGAAALRYNPLTALGVGVWDHFHPNEGNSDKWYNELAKQTTSGSGSSKDDLVSEIRNLTRTIKDQREFIGGGTRSRSMPTGWKAQQLENVLDGHVQAIGAFTVA